MTIAIRQTATAVTTRGVASFRAVGATGSVTYSVASGGAGGSINPSTGSYTAPQTLSADPKKLFDTIAAVDSIGGTASARILVGSPLLLFCEIIQREMNLADGRVYLWDQKIMQPSDNDLYIAVSVPMAKPFGNVNKFNGSTNQSDQSVSMSAALDLDIISRGPAARDRKEEIILALESDYSRKQQDANSFYVGKLDTRFTNIGDIDGAAIPYRFRISVRLQYVFIKSKPTEYFSTFNTPPISSES